LPSVTNIRDQPYTRDQPSGTYTRDQNFAYVWMLILALNHDDAQGRYWGNLHWQVLQDTKRLANVVRRQTMDGSPTQARWRAWLGGCRSHVAKIGLSKMHRIHF